MLGPVVARAVVLVAPVVLAAVRVAVAHAARVQAQPGHVAPEPVLATPPRAAPGLVITRVAVTPPVTPQVPPEGIKYCIISQMQFLGESNRKT